MVISFTQQVGKLQYRYLYMEKDKKITATKKH